jgi:monofunctional biosynthetic peptidoglycan transglycosylase
MARAKTRKAASKRGWGGRILGWLLKGFFLFVLLSLLWVLLYRFVPPPITFTMLGDVLSGRSVDKDWMSLDEIDRDMARAAIAAEDSKFCTHRGFDQDAIAAAMRRNAEGRGVIRGGSTISQQTAKNAFLWQGGGYFRKGLEAWFTLLIENLWSKQRIMEVYLNIAETGIGTYGVNAGAQRYFNKDASNLTRPGGRAHCRRAPSAQEARGDHAVRLHTALRQQRLAPDWRCRPRRPGRLPAGQRFRSSGAGRSKAGNQPPQAGRDTDRRTAAGTRRGLYPAGPAGGGAELPAEVDPPRPETSTESDSPPVETNGL